MKKLNYRGLFLLVSAFLCNLLSAQNELYISAVLDAGLTGGLPKAVKLCANSTIDDLSVYGIASVNNGTGSAGQEYALVGSMAAGDCIWIASEEVGFTEFFGCPPDYANSAMNVNGDDAIELYKDGVVVDLFGDPNLDGTGQCWEYLDGYAVRTTTVPNAGVFDITCSTNEWTYSGVDALDGVMTYADVIPSEPFGPFETECAEVSYYSTIDTVALGCAPLKSALRNLIANQSNIPYGPGQGYDIIDFICQYDYQNGAVVDRYASTSYANCQGTRYTSGDTPTEVGMGWNREHVFPRSWWGGSTMASQYTDLHNVFPSDAYVNSQKSNFPLGKVLLGLTSESVIGNDLLGCTQGCNDQAFEPADQYKGDFARSYLYMAIRYENEMSTWESANCVGDGVLNGDSYTVFEECLLARLLQWHQNDPVDDLERNRNDGIFDVQGNRNPLVDHPSWSELIWGVSNGAMVEPACNPNACDAVVWEVVEITANSGFNNGGTWTEDGAGYTANGYCGGGCAEEAESWLIYGPLDLSNSASLGLSFTAQEQFGETILDFMWSSSYTGCPGDAGNNWNSAGSLAPSDLPSQNTPYAQSMDFDGATGSEVYIAIRYQDDGLDGYSFWRLDQFAIESDVCPSVGVPVVSSCTSCPEDLNNDGQVDIADFLIFNSAFGQNCTCPSDFNGDGVVAIDDFLQFNSAYGQPCQ